MYQSIVLSLLLLAFSYSSYADDNPIPANLKAPPGMCTWVKSNGSTICVPTPYPSREEVTILCPAASSYSIPSGYRLAAISPSCQAVFIPMDEISSGLMGN